MNDKLLGKILQSNGTKLVEKAVDKLVHGDARAEGRKPSLGARIAGAALLRVATKSVPGALIVGGGLLAKHLHERHQASKAAKFEAAAQAAKPAGKGSTRA